MASLPPELILDILSRLPVKSLCQFKCVCKSWFSLINDHRFAKLHLNRTQRVKLFISTKFLYNVDLETMTDDDDKVVAVEDDSFPWRSIPIESPSWTPNHYFRQSPKWINFMGSCHGLVCLEVFRDVWLYNPSTKQYKHIPSFGSMRSKVHGLGYIESQDDYNIVRIDYSGKYVAIYSIRNDMWTSIEINLTLMCAGFVESAFLNGAIHWAVGTSRTKVEILKFDLLKKTFETLPLPEFDIQKVGNFCFGTLGGCLCFSTGMGGRYHDELWIMKEYGVKESWTRIIRIPPGIRQTKPLGYLNGTDTMVLFMDLYQLVFCNAKDGNLKNIEVDGFSDDVDEDDDAEWIDFNSYVESLVSPSLETNVQSEGLQYWFQ